MWRGWGLGDVARAIAGSNVDDQALAFVTRFVACQLCKPALNASVVRLVHAYRLGKGKCDPHE